MLNQDLVLYEADFKLLEKELSRLNHLANGKVSFLVDKDGQLIASVGETANIDTTSLASLTAGNIAATGGMAKLLGEKEFSLLFHEGEKDNIHISLVGQRAILVIIFDHRSSLGLVRLRAKKSVIILTEIFNKLLVKMTETDRAAEDASLFTEITEDDIENLFS
ncbi:MAG: roadblock/LC7 domain-containing protein [Nitrospiria bacterium]